MNLQPGLQLPARNDWEAIDLGLQLARNQLPRLAGGLALLILPTLLLLSLLLWRWPSVVMLLLWWLKPLFERLPLFTLAHWLFGEPADLRAGLRRCWASRREGVAAALLWQRSRLDRSYRMPLLLEGQNPPERRLRQQQLGGSLPASGLTLFGAHLESLLSLGLPLVLLFAFNRLPGDLDAWLALIQNAENTLWLAHAGNLLYALVLILWEPFYVAAGFTLYLQRRCEREAWDLELAFRRMAARLAPTSLLLLLAIGLLGSAPAPLQAADLPIPLDAPASCAVSRDEDPGPDTDRLQHQPLSSREARDAAQRLLQAPPFHNIEQKVSWQWGDAAKPVTSGTTAEDSPLDLLVVLLEILLWGILAAGALLLARHHREWRTLLGLRPTQTADEPAPPLVCPTRVAGLSPAELEQRIRQLWPQKPRPALALFYSALLAELGGLLPAASARALTEGEVLQLIEQQQPRLLEFARPLLAAWQASAYGHQPPPASLLEVLCQQWHAIQTASSAEVPA